MPLALAPLIAISLGLGLGLVGAAARGARGWLAAETRVRAFALLVFFPVVAFSALVRAPWSLLHFASAQRLPSALMLAAAAGCAALVPLAHRYVDALAALPRARAIAVAALPAACALVVSLLLHRRVGVLSAAVSGLADPQPLLGSLMGSALLLLDLLLVLGAWLTASALGDVTPPDGPAARVGTNVSAPSAARRRPRPGASGPLLGGSQIKPRAPRS